MGLFKKFSIIELSIFFVIPFILYLSNIQNNSKRNTDLPQVYDSAVKSGEVFQKKGDFQRAVDAFRSALRLAGKIEKKDGEVKCHMSLGLLFWNLGQLKNSSSHYDHALQFAESFNLKTSQEKCKSALEIYRLYEGGKEYRSKGEHRESIQSFQNAIDLAIKTGSREHEVKCLRQLSITYWQLNDFKKFFSFNEEALNIARSLNHRKEEGRCLNNIGLFYWKLDNYSKALIYYENAIKVAKSEKNKLNEAECLNNIGIIYQELGNYEKALKYLTDSLSMNQQLGDEITISMNMNNIGETFRGKGLFSGLEENFYKALDYFENCLKLARKTGDKRTEVYVLNNIGTVFSDLKKYQDALKYFRIGYETAEEIQDVEAMGMLLNNIGIVHFNQGNNGESTRYYLRSINFSQKIEGGQILWEAYFGLGQCYEQRNEFSKAVMYYKKAIDIIDNIRSQILLDVYKAGFARDKLKVYEFLINLLHRLNMDDPSNKYDKEIFHIVERAKARAFLESLGESKIDIQARLTPELMKKEIEISNRISLTILNLSRLDLSKKKREELLIKLRKGEDEYLELIAKMRAEIPEVANLVSPQPARLQQIQQLLDEKSALIEYFLGENHSVMFYITKTEFDVYGLPSRSEIERSLRAYLKILSAPPKGKFWGTLAANRLYKELLFPLEEKSPDSIENLIIVPDGVLHYLPFETLMPNTPNQSSEYEYLIENYRISYMPSSSALLFLSKSEINQGSPKGLLAFGNPSYTLRDSKKRKRYNTYVEVLRELYLNQGFDFSPLPYSEEEVLRASAYFPSERKDIYLEDDAKEDIVKKIPLKDYQIIHFACHGFFDEKFPFRSALVLTLDEDVQEDGFLQVREIYNLRLNSDLIVLSACQTGKGRLERGEGLLGLPRVFFYAGAKSIVSTLWKISDKSTAIFMNYFYRYLSHGNDKAQALRLAKLRMLESKYFHPFYWAAFALNGDYSSRIDFR